MSKIRKVIGQQVFLATPPIEGVPREHDNLMIWKSKEQLHHGRSSVLTPVLTSEGTPTIGHTLSELLFTRKAVGG